MILFIILNSLSGVVFACKSRWGGDFFEVAPKSDFVALVQILEHLEKPLEPSDRYLFPNQMEVKGKETRKILPIGTDWGCECGRIPLAKFFEKDQYYVIAFYKDKRPNSHYKDDYFAGGCRGYWLKADLKGTFVLFKERLPQGVLNLLPAGSPSYIERKISFKDLKKRLNKSEKQK